MEIPSELQYRFLREANIKPTYINKTLNYLYNQDILNNQCLKSITKYEIEKYALSYNPYQYCEFVVTELDTFNYSYYHGLIVKSIGSHSFKYSYYDCGIMEYVKTHGDYHDTIGQGVVDETPFNDHWKNEHKINSVIKTLPDSSMIIGYDLITTFYVLKNRLSCQHENFAKKAVIDTLEYVYNNATPEKVLLYLWCHAMIMGIYIPDTPTIFYIRDDSQDEDLELIKEHNEKLYFKIQQHLNLLDDSIYFNYPKYILDDGKQYAQTYYITDDITL